MTIADGFDPRMLDALAELKATFPRRARETKRLLLQSGMSEESIDAALTITTGQPSKEIFNELPILDGTWRPLTPMLRARYSFASSIRDMTWTFPSLKESRAIISRRTFSQAVAAHEGHWEGSAPAQFDRGRLSLCAFASLADGDLAYLVWGEEQEPEVWAYFGQSETRHESMLHFVECLCST
ncbi:hypothetical protein [Clavibacter sp. CT19]|uniref:hypothetical protein n=1 Tax=unclassified Clavibacter TaxID=2626594 RepID=UPI0022EB38F0|nr:hypothetical protein [Clavibacter sp. CT19]MDA3804474.1 hypothetical protein [Clavibacter sp. CT19]